MTIVVSDRTPELDANGYLRDYWQWDEALARRLAYEEGIELNAEHWEVIDFLRCYYDKYQIAPAIRVLTRAIGRMLGPEKADPAYLYGLFPLGPAVQACRIAGLPKPTGCV